MEPPWEGGTKVYINGPGHMTKMAAMPIYGKNHQQSSSPEPVFCDLETWHVASSLNRLANQSQISNGASLGTGKESLYEWSRSHNQDGHHAHIW